MSGASRRYYEMDEIRKLRRDLDPVGVWVVFGGQAGSEGKGAICGHLALKYRWKAVVSNFMPNAGHTWRGSRMGEEPWSFVTRTLPIAAISDSVDKLVLGPGSVIDPDQLTAEIEFLWDRGINVEGRLVIHPRAMILQPGHAEWERENLQYLSSTCKGSAAAVADKMRRIEGVQLAADHGWIKSFVPSRFETGQWLNDLVNGGGGVMIEGSQGFELDINHGYSYPYCTSRQCTPAQLVADCGLDGRLVSRSIAVVRSFPIRVGNAYDEAGQQIGTSGPWGEDEMKWEDLSLRLNKDVREKTTVTQKERRIFAPDWKRLSQMSLICRPTEVALTFADYIDPNIYGMTNERYLEEFGGTLHNLSRPVSNYVYRLMEAVSRPICNPSVPMIKTGEDESHILDWM